MAGILGSSVSTKAQLQKILSNHGVTDKDDIIDLYMKYGVEYGVQHNVAFAMCLIYTDYFQNEIVNNNLVGIGLQFQVNKLEEFSSIEECIIAQYEILRTGADATFKVESPHSFTYYNLLDNVSSEGEPEILVGHISDLYDVYISWKLDQANYSSNDFFTIQRDMDIVRLVIPSYDTLTGSYYYVRVKTAKTREELIKDKGTITRLGFKDIHIHVGRGYYTLEVGREKSQKAISRVFDNLRIFGYSGYIGTRSKEEDA